MIQDFKYIYIYMGALVAVLDPLIYDATCVCLHVFIAPDFIYYSSELFLLINFVSRIIRKINW